MTHRQALGAMQRILSKAKKILKNERRWSKGQWCLDAKGNMIGSLQKGVFKFTPHGAVYFAGEQLGFSQEISRSVMRVLQNCLIVDHPSVQYDERRWGKWDILAGEMAPTHWDLDRFNAATSHESLLKLFDEAIKSVCTASHDSYWIPLDIGRLRCRSVLHRRLSRV